MAKGRVYRFMMAALAAVLLSGCGAEMEQPLPVTPLSGAERARLEGAWVVSDDHGEHVVDVHVTCEGVAHLAMVGWDKDKFRIGLRATWQFARSVQGKHNSGFISLRLEEEDGKPEKDPPYIPLKYRFMSDNMLVIWPPRLDAVAAAIKAGRLKGQVKEFTNEITSPPKAILDYLDSPDGDLLFEYREPMVLRKVAQAVYGEDERQDCAKK